MQSCEVLDQAILEIAPDVTLDEFLATIPGRWGRGSGRDRLIIECGEGGAPVRVTVASPSFADLVDPACVGEVVAECVADTAGSILAGRMSGVPEQGRPTPVSDRLWGIGRGGRVPVRFTLDFDGITGEFRYVVEAD